MRSPFVYWSLVGLLAFTTVTSIEHVRSDLDRRASALGPTVPAVIVVGNHDAGDRLDGADVERRELPRSAVPADALTEPPDGRRLRTDVTAGEVLTTGRFAPGRPSATAARIPAGWRAIAVPLPPAALELRTGDHVDLLALGPGGSSDRIVGDAVVVSATETAATVAVPDDEVTAVADAVLAGTLTVVLNGPD